MKTLDIKIYEFANRDLESELATVAEIFKNNVQVKLNFTVEKKEGTPTWYEDREGVFYITKQWLTKNVVDDAYDICVALFNDDQWRKEHNNTIGGTAEASPLNGTGLIYMTATEGQTKTLKEGGREYTELVWRLLHELSHVAYDDLMERPDLDKTHWWDYEQKNLFGALQGIDLSHYTPKRESMNTIISLLKKLADLYKQLTPQKPRSRLEEWATAIKRFEGWAVPGEYLNGKYYPQGSLSYRHKNPGNLRYSKYQAGTKNNFSYFNTYAEGWKALLFQLRIAVDGRSSVYNPDMTLLDFFKVYAPSSDNNYPKKYASFVSKQLGVTTDTMIKDI